MAYYALTDIQKDRKVVKKRGDTVTESEFKDQWEYFVNNGVVGEEKPEEVLDNNLIAEADPPVPADDEATKKAEADFKKSQSNN